VLGGFVALYLLGSIAVGLLAARRVHGVRDFAVAGRSLPFYVVLATVFATWFGSETVLGIPAKFIGHGLGGVVEDPFGSSACLVLVGVFFAARLYRMDLLTIGDFFRRRYGPVVEVVTSLVIVASYLGWVSAQIVALGLVLNIVSAGLLGMQGAMVLGAGVVVLYTVFGGMFSVAWTDFVQMVLIVVGLLYIAWFVSGEVGGVGVVVEHARSAGRLELLPPPRWRDVLWFVGSAITMMLGSIPQQDVFQRVTSARTARTAAWGAVAGGVAYFAFAFVPIFLGSSAELMDPPLFAQLARSDPQRVLPELVLRHAPPFAQVMFFGALLSAIMSTASGTLLAPSVTFTENVLRRVLRHELSERRLLWTMRGVVTAFSCVVTLFALRSSSSIYEMVGNAYKVTLTGAFVPLAFGLYWRRANTAGALLSIASGVGTWLGLEVAAPEGFVPPQLAGFAVGVAAMVLGSLATQPASAHAPGGADGGVAAEGG
jgi:SSS family transporter